MADAYKVKQDTALPQALRLVREDEIEGKVYDERGVYYREGDYVLAENLSPSLDVDQLKEAGLLEDASKDDAEAWANSQSEFSTFIPEHEAERYAQVEYGHQVVERDQVLELKSAGADAAKQAVEASREDEFDQRPQITEQKSFIETPALADVSRGDENNVPTGGDGKQDAVDEDELAAAGVEQPPGHLVGKTLAAAEGEDVSEPKKARRARPGTGSSGQRESEKDNP